MSSYQLVVDKCTQYSVIAYGEKLLSNLIWCNNWSTRGCCKTRNVQEQNGTKPEVIVHNTDAGHVARN